MLNLCICTHNPRLKILGLCLEAIETQISPPPFSLLLVDNASQPPLAESLLDTLRQRGVSAALIREARLGLTAARLAAFQQTSGQWLVFIDDDNVVAPNFLQLGAEFARAHPEVGAFGGRISLPPEIEAPEWMTSLLGWMGVKEEGDKILIDSTVEWGPHDPPGAGLWVRRALLARFADRARANPAVFELGRRGRELASCEDAVIVKGARDLGFYNAYVPALRVIHYLKPERFTFWHGVRSFIAYGRSIALYERIMGLGGAQLAKPEKAGALLAGLNAFKRERHRSIRYASTQAVYQWAYERRRYDFGCYHQDVENSKAHTEALAPVTDWPLLRTGASDWFPYLTVGECGVHTGGEIKSIKDKVGHIACTTPMAIVSGHYKLLPDVSIDGVESYNRGMVTFEIWSGSELIAIDTAKPGGNPSLEFDVADELSRRAIELRVRATAPTEFSIRGVAIEKVSDSVDPAWRERLAQALHQYHMAQLLAQLRNVKDFASLSKLLSLIAAGILRRIQDHVK